MFVLRTAFASELSSTAMPSALQLVIHVLPVPFLLKVLQRNELFSMMVILASTMAAKWVKAQLAGTTLAG